MDTPAEAHPVPVYDPAAVLTEAMVQKYENQPEAWAAMLGIQNLLKPGNTFRLNEQCEYPICDKFELDWVDGDTVFGHEYGSPRGRTSMPVAMLLDNFHLVGGTVDSGVGY